MKPPAFTFPVDPSDLFHERGRQMRGWGIPRATLERVRAATRDMWSDGPGGWAYEWTREAETSERRGRSFEAAMCFGAAKFPCISTELQRGAYERQLACYLTSSSHFSARFERLELAVRYGDATTRVPVHLFAPPRGDDRPLVVLSGGVDTLKMELHRLALALARVGGFRVAAIDMPGTGESGIALAEDAHAIYEGVLAQLAGGTRTGAWGVSFGGHWAAKLACRGTVDAAVDMGGPIGTTLFARGELPNGMRGIVANAVGAPALVDSDVPPEMQAQFSFAAQGLLAKRSSSPLLVFNGARDPYVPQEDATAFAGWPATTVWLFERGDHCAANMLERVMPAAIAWLRRALHGDTPALRLAAALTERLLPRRLPLGVA